MSFLSYAHVSRCAHHVLEPTDHRLIYADDIMICTVSPHSVVAIRSASFNAPWFFIWEATTTVDWTRRACCSAVLVDRCCDDIKHAMRHKADCLNTYCKNMPFSIKWYVYNCLYSIPTFMGEHLHLHITHKWHVCEYMFLHKKMILSAWTIIPIILSMRSCYTLYIYKSRHGSMVQMSDTCLPPLGSRVCILVTLFGFCGGWNVVWIGFSRGFSRYLLPQISFHHYISSIPVVVHRA